MAHIYFTNKFKSLGIVCVFIFGVSVSVSSCSKDDDSTAVSQSPAQSDIINAVVPSEEVSTFFNAELPAHGQQSFWDCEVWSPDQDMQYPDEICTIVRSKQELAAIYKGSKALPDIDFAKFSLVVGRSIIQVDKLESMEIKDAGTSYVVNINTIYFTNVRHFDSIGEFNFWGLFPRLDEKTLDWHITKRDAERVTQNI